MAERSPDVKTPPVAVPETQAPLTNPTPLPAPPPALAPDAIESIKRGYALYLQLLAALEVQVGVVTKLRDEVKELLDRGSWFPPAETPKP
jgi:hypothetical protein